MIKENDAFKVFEINMDRTNMLIKAIDKIGGYNYLYQEKMFEEDPDYRNLVKSIQDKELLKISKSCFEHAIISIATTFETYLKELIQELLFKHGDYFLDKDSIWQERINTLIRDDNLYDFELILNHLKLRNRFEILEFLNKHNISLLTSDQENLITAIYIKRNNFVHNGSTVSEKAKSQIKEFIKVDKKKYLELSIKWTRTKFERMIRSVHKNVLQTLS